MKSTLTLILSALMILTTASTFAADSATTFSTGTFSDPQLDSPALSAGQSSIDVDSMISENTQTFPVYVKFGPASSGVRISNLDENRIRESNSEGFNLSVTTDRSLGTDFAIETGLRYIQKGMIAENLGSRTEYTAEYLVVPFMGKKKITLDNKSDVSILVGPYLGFATSRSQSNRTAFDFAETSSPYSFFDLGLTLGAQYELRLTPELTGIAGLGYDYGLTRNEGLNANTGSFSGASNFRTSSWMGQIGVGFKL